MLKRFLHVERTLGKYSSRARTDVGELSARIDRLSPVGACVLRKSIFSPYTLPLY